MVENHSIFLVGPMAAIRNLVPMVFRWIPSDVNDMGYRQDLLWFSRNRDSLFLLFRVGRLACPKSVCAQVGRRF